VAGFITPGRLATFLLRSRGRMGSADLRLAVSRVRLPGLRQRDYFRPRLVGYLLNEQLQGKLLSSYKISQAYLGVPGRATLAGPAPRFLIGRRPPKIVHRPKTTTHMVDIVHRRLTSCLDISNTYARLGLASQLHPQALVAPLRKAARV
jgi:hypothetical protein